MPAASTPVHYPQSNPGACLPACIRMVMAAMGDERTEAEWADILGSYEFGTPASRVKRLSKLGYQVEYGPSSIDELERHIKNGLHPIAFVWAEMLTWADFGGFHAIVIVSVITPNSVMLLDPALETGPTELSIDGFLAAWEEFAG